MRVEDVLSRLPWRRRPEVTGLVLSGGGARASFQIGALRYLYEEVGIRPEVIAGTSAGSVLAAVLAQSDEPAEQRRLVGELERVWRGMRHSSDMFVPLAWFDRLRERGPEWMAAFARRQQRQRPLGRSFARVANLTAPRLTTPARSRAGTASAVEVAAAEVGPDLEAPASAATDGSRISDTSPGDDEVQGGARAVRTRLRTIGARTRQARPAPPDIEDHGPLGSLGVLEFLTALREVGRARPDLEVILRGAEREQSMYRLGPIVERLLDPEVFVPERVASSGILLRIAVVSLEAGELRYVTETGTLLDRQGRELDEGPVDLVDAVRASCAIPAVLPPVRLGEEHYVDGGVRETLPVEVAVEQLGVTRCFAVVASPPGVPREESYAGRDMLSIVLRSTAGIMSDEGLHDEVSWARRAGAVVIGPELDVHDVLTVDPGLTAISMDYGYMRAAEAVRGAGPAVSQLVRDIIALRKEIWQLEVDLLGPVTQAMPEESDGRPAGAGIHDGADGSPAAAPPAGSPTADDPDRPAPDLGELAALKQRLRDLVGQTPLDYLPPGARGWWRGFEAHSFPVGAEPDWA